MVAPPNGLSKRTALVLYGSETGNAQDVAEEIGRLLERLRFVTQVAELDTVQLGHLLRYSVVVFAISTTGQGELPANAQGFWKLLRSVRLRPASLQSLRFTSFGLGDSSYPQFNYAHRKLCNRLAQLGAQTFFDRGEADEQHPEGIDGAFLPWSTKLKAQLLSLYPLPDGVIPIPETELLQPPWLLDFVAGDGHPTADGTAHTVDLNVPTKGGFEVKLLSNKRLTPITHWQDVRHLEFETSQPIMYEPGAVLTIYPKNFPEDVEALLSALGWLDIGDRPIIFRPTDPNAAINVDHPPPPLRGVRPDSHFTLRGLLLDYLDIMSIPRRSFFAHLAHFTEDEFQKERLLEFTNPDLIDELYDYTTRPRRSILEVLQEFDTVHIPWQRIASIIPTTRGRQFSIASGGSLKAAPDGCDSTRIELLVAIVKYKTVIKRIRQGVCTRYIAALEPGQRLNVTLQKGGLGVRRDEIDRPVVMIGPGTGVAPMRSMIYERLAWRKEKMQDRKTNGASEDAQRDMLFFGNRNRHADYFFEDEWSTLHGQVPLEVYPAFSRDQREKVYVQDLVRDHSAQVYDALAYHNGFVYVCGSSGRMPQAVREALIEVFQKHRVERVGRDEAEKFLLRMEKEGRYKQETW